jgi:hypothetical protein
MRAFISEFLMSRTFFWKLGSQAYSFSTCNSVHGIVKELHRQENCLTRGQCYKAFYGRKSRILVKSWSVCSWQAFSLLFFGKARSLPLSAAPERCFTWVFSCLTCKHYTILERLARDKHSSLVQKIVTYGCKKFYNIGPRNQ